MTIQTTSAGTTARAPSRARTVLRWLPSFLGFPLGGFAALLLVGPVDTVGRAALGGLVTGLVLGTAQAIGLRWRGRRLLAWTALTGGGLAVGLTAGAALVGFAIDPPSLAIEGAVSGAAVGLAQTILLVRRFRIAAVWPAYLGVAWALGWLVSAGIGVQVVNGFTVFGASGALTVTVLTSVLPLLAAGRRS